MLENAMEKYLGKITQVLRPIQQRHKKKLKIKSIKSSKLTMEFKQYNNHFKRITCTEATYKDTSKEYFENPTVIYHNSLPCYASLHPFKQCLK